MTDYKLVPVDAIRRAASILGSQGFEAWDQLASELESMIASAPAVQGEPVFMWHRGATDDESEVVDVDCACPCCVPLYTAPQPAEQKPFEWPLLDAPALIGGVVVGKGCSTGTVVAIAKRKHQYEVETSPEEHARREKAFKDMLRQIHEGIGQQPAEQPPAPDVAGLVQQHHRDSAELRRLCQARDAQRDGRLAALERAAKAEADVAGLVEALEEGLRAIGDHHAPGDCYATGPMTGDPFRDLVQCPACSFIAMCDDLLAAHRKQQGGEVCHRGK